MKKIIFVVCLLSMFLFIENTYSQVQSSAIKQQAKNRLKVDIPAFLSARTAQEKELLASRIISSVIQQADSNKIKTSLAEATGALLSASGTNAPTVAAAIVKAAGTNYSDIVISVIAIATASEKESDIKIREVAVDATAKGSRNTAQAALTNPEKQIDNDLRQKVLHTARDMKFMQENWNTEASKPKIDILADRDGGETPCQREYDSNNFNNKPKSK